MILTVEQRSAGLKAIYEAKDAYVNDLHKERALIDAAELFRADGITAWEEVERLREEAKEKNEAIEELHKRASHYAAVRDNAVKVGYKQAQQLQDALNTLKWYANDDSYKQEWELFDLENLLDGYWEAPEVINDKGERAKAAIQRIQEGTHGE